MLSKVIKPDGEEVSFKYDALGRRIRKDCKTYAIKWVWDGNVPLHECKEVYSWGYTQEKGTYLKTVPKPLVTWVFEEGTFVPVAKFTDKKNYSIVTNYMDTPEAMYDSDGNRTWSCDLDSYGRVREFTGKLTDCPFRYQGQYEDEETGLYYNRFRFYDSSTGSYISQDPIRLAGGTNFYSYIINPNNWVDVLGLVADANNGNGGKHGGTEHDKWIRDKINDLPKDATDIRMNQQQVDASGDLVGTNRPDIQYNDTDGLHHNIEYDTSLSGSEGHQRVVTGNDSDAINEFYIKGVDDPIRTGPLSDEASNNKIIGCGD